MKKEKKIKNKIAMLMCAAMLPVSASGMMLLSNSNVAKADSSAATFSRSYVKEISLTNSNFNSSSSTTLSTSPSGWTRQLDDGKTTAGVINTGTSFQSYMTGTYRLASNPLAKATDKHILMLNSKTATSGDFSSARQGYKSSNITLEANSYYSFQVAFKSDTNYRSHTGYQKKGEIEENTTLSKATFNGQNSTDPVVFGEDAYISFTYKNRQFYLRKQLTQSHTIADAQTAVKVFYEDEKYVGVLLGETDAQKAYYVEKAQTTDPTEGDNLIDINENAIAYVCNLEYDPAGSNGNGNYKLPAGTEYFEAKTEYDSISSTAVGSIYLSGLTDENDNPVKAEYVQVSSKDWTTFQFFVATGNKTQTVNLDLWLGATKTAFSQAADSNGVVFFDDCHVVQYSENAFWKTYQKHFADSYSQDFSSNAGIETVVTKCSSLVDLRSDKTLKFENHNFNFEQGIYNETVTSLQNWKKDEQSGGNARIFDVNNPQYFKSATGFDFVGSNLSCIVNLDGEKVDVLNENKYVLALWANDNHVKVSSNEIDIAANQIYKIKANFKISGLSKGNAYLFVKENDKVLNTYGLSDYALAQETASSALSSNSDNNFVNGYNTVEFFVKGGTLYNSSVTLSLGLGKTDEAATGCVIFDDITIEKASSEDFSSATNKLELAPAQDGASVANGSFDKSTISANSPLGKPENWSITGGSGVCFGGTLNTDALQFAEYEKQYRKFKEEGKTAENNPYYWASFGNPLNPNSGNATPNNIMMLSNITKTWQTMRSDNISLSANTTHKISFDFQTINAAKGLTLKVYGDDGFLLASIEDLLSENAWSKEYSIFFTTFSGASNISLEFSFDNTKGSTNAFAYFDNFKLESNVQADNRFTVVDMSNFFLNLPSNNISKEDVSKSETPAFSTSSKENAGIVKSEAFKEGSQFAIYKNEFTGELDKDKNVFFLSNPTNGSQTLQSKFNFDMEANGYYTLSFKLKTYFEDGNLDKDKKPVYGATVGLTGFDYAKDLKSADEYSTFTLHFHPTEAASAKLYIALISDSFETKGSMALYDVEFKSVTEDEYNSAKEIVDGKDFDVNKDKVFVSSVNGEAPTPPDNTPDDSETPSTANQNFDWLLIPSLIFGLAIVVAVIGFFLRKIKIKKIDIKRKNSYDRRTSTNVEMIKLQARKEQETQIAQVQTTVDKFEKELQNLEKEHKAKVLALREKDGSSVSKETDKEFKRFAQKRTVISEKLDSLKKQIAEMKTAEYILNLERKFYAQDQMKQHELAKASKKIQKMQDKSAENMKNGSDKTKNQK